MIVLLVFLSILSLCLLLWQISNLISVFYGSPYVKTDRRVIRRALELADLKKSEVFYDLGSGNGDVLIEAAKFGAKATGFEISPYYFIWSQIRIFLWAELRTFRYLNIHVRYQNIKYIDLRNADVVYCYLLPEMLEKLAPKFNREMKKGSRLISIGFPVIHAGAAKIGKYEIDGRKIFIYKF